MSSSYFLINDEIRFYFESPTKSLYLHQQELHLTPREAQALQFLLDNRDGTIKPDDLAIHLWGEASVNVDYANKKSQAINLISKVRRRFEKLGYRVEWLKNQGNNGYKVNCSVDFISSEVLRQQSIERKVDLEKKQQRYKLVKYSGFSVLLTVLVFVLLYSVFAKSSIDIDNVSPLPPLSGISVEPNLSPDGKAVAFSYQSSDEQAQIYVKVDSDINYRLLTSGFLDQGPVFSPSGKRLVFHRLSEAGCEIRMLSLDEDYNLTDVDRKVADCSVYTAYSSISWVSESLLLFTNRTAEESPMQVYQVSLKSGNITPYLAIDSIDYYGAGYYFVSYDSNKETLFVLDGEDWGTTHIYRYGKDKKRVLLKTIKGVVKSITLMDNKVVFRDINNQLKAFRVDDPLDVEVIYSSPLSAISHPHINVTGSTIAYAKGNFYKSSIFRYDLKTGVRHEVMAATERLELPKATDKEVLVVARAEGIYQIYVYANNTRTQLSNFKVNHNIINYASSPDKRWLAIYFADGTRLYRRDQKGLIEVEWFKRLTHPGFSQSSQRLLLSQLQDFDSGQSRIVEYDLSQYHQTGKVESTDITVKDAAFGAYWDDGFIYTPSDKKGLYRLKVGKMTVINETIEPASPDSFCFTDTHVYLLTQDHKIVGVELQTGAVTVLPDILYGDFSISQNSIFHLEQSAGHMDIIVGDIIKNRISYNNL